MEAGAVKKQSNQSKNFISIQINCKNKYVLLLFPSNYIFYKLLQQVVYLVWIHHICVAEDEQLIESGAGDEHLLKLWNEKETDGAETTPYLNGPHPTVI